MNKEKEPVFVLRANDVTAPKVILLWIAKNFWSVSNEQLRSAFERALDFKEWYEQK